ncbi:hypothetical protein FCK90_04485 [Kocuria coralli]|uniref:Serine/threonine protein kinase n=1 Tax=Kocuria coralli TaxID=1461025 RepID=A0A5J5KYF3_9MICC|nr:hypothetical protein [Kocuria coralli]KAA9394797.1 hypothetical protein FCK90_04485 [Kocuria coralli]
MPQPISLGTVLGGRYKVLDEVLTTPEQDHVLGGQDQILGREVTILVPSERHTSRVVENARAMAIGAVDADLHILDLGQSGKTTYLVTSFAAPSVLIEELLAEPGTIDDDTLSDDIFGRPRSASSAGAYVVDDGEPDTAGEETSEEFFDQWDDDDIGTAPAAPAVERHLGRIRRAPESSTRATLFDRAAAGRGNASGKAPVRDAHRIDPTYDGDNRYDSYEYEYTSGAKGRAAAGDSTETLDRGAVRDHPKASASRSAPAEPKEKKSRKGGLIILLLALLAVLAVCAGLIFGGLGSLFDDDEGTGSPSANGSSAPAEEATPVAEVAAAASAVRLVPDNPTFMADQDGTLPNVIDEDTETAWTSYGFSSAEFGQLVSGVALAVRFEEPTVMNQIAITQESGTGGAFTVYVADEPSLEGAVEVGQGSFQGPQTTVQLGEAAQSEEHSYLIVEWTELPTLTQPIAGYNYGLRISDVNVS